MRRLITAAMGLARDDGGFTIVEVLVASLVLTVGLIGAFMALSVSVHQSAAVRARQGAVTLLRQIGEDARSISYSQLSSATLVSQLQAMPGLASSGSGSTWTIVRNGQSGSGVTNTYTVTASLNTFNDTKDSPQPAQAIDFKQVTVTVSWTTYPNTTRQLSETVTLTRAGQDPGLIAAGLQLSSPTQGTAGLSGGVFAPVVASTGITSLEFSVSAPTGTTAIVWSLNGAKQTSWNGSAPSSGTTWTSAPWSLTGVSDGTYTIGAQAEDANGVDGPGVTIPVRLIRNVPSAPTITGAGFNPTLPEVVNGQGQTTTAAELQWSPNPELNVVGYRIYGPSSSTTPICQTVTSTSDAYCNAQSTAWCSNATTCIDLNPPSTNASNLTYTVKALYYDVNNNLQEGTAATVTLASGTPAAPDPPTGLTAVENSDDTATLTWTPPSGGATPAFYRIYRDGVGFDSRYDVLRASSCSTTCTYTDSDRAEQHTYYVTAVGGSTVGSDMAESPEVGPVTK